MENYIVVVCKIMSDWENGRNKNNTEERKRRRTFSLAHRAAPKCSVCVCECVYVCVIIIRKRRREKKKKREKRGIVNKPPPPSTPALLKSQHTAI